MSRRGIVAALALSAAVTVPASAVGAADARAARSGGPAYCKPIKRAFSGLATTDPNDFRAYNRAYGTAAKLLRKAAKSAPKGVAEPLRHVSERFHEIVEEGEPLEVADIHRLGPDVTTISGVVEQRCGFTVEGAPPST
jgi:hypothetical protein